MNLFCRRVGERGSIACQVGAGVQTSIPMETHSTCDFPGGVRTRSSSWNRA